MSRGLTMAALLALALAAGDAGGGAAADARSRRSRRWPGPGSTSPRPAQVTRIPDMVRIEAGVVTQAPNAARGDAAE